MARYDYGYRRDGGYWRGDWSAPSPPEMRGGYGRGRSDGRPWAGGFREGYQGGMGGMPTEGYRDTESRGGRDEWWLGGHHPGRYDEAYDRAYREFDERNHPRYSPVGGTYHAMGGSYQYRRPPRPLRDDMWFSDWTRWF